MCLINLVESQINGCSYYVDMNGREAKHDGETEQRLWLVAAWKDRCCSASVNAWPFPEPKRSPTSPTQASRRIFNAEAQKNFSGEELVKLTMAVGVINTLNRLCVTIRAVYPVAEIKAA